jgi:predicted outer membrane repeat protein
VGEVLLNRKLMVLAIILVSLLTVSAVSAAENATADADTLASELQANLNDNEEIDMLKLSDNEGIVGESDNGTFMDLQTKIDAAGDGGVVNLENNYSYDDTFSSNGITIKNPITINGNGFEINGLGQSRIFSINASNNVTLNDITFVNGYSSLGGAIIFNGDASGIVINNCRFIDNVASENGGAIYANGTFMNNAINNSEFSSNIATKNGGAIYLLKDCNASIFENTTFSNNSAKNADGGAINFHAGLLNTAFRNLNFTGNRAKNSGGAINTDNNVNDRNSYVNISFINNAANRGGAMNGYGYSNYNSFESCEFRNNSANNCGGAIYYGRNMQDNTFKYCVFADNSAKDNGGAIYSYRNSINTKFTNIVFANNTASNNGGAVYNRGFSDSEVYSNTVFFNNSAASVDGGAINVYDNLAGATFKNVTFENNRAAGNGGAINVNDDSKYNTFTDTRFINNTATKNGGALSFSTSKRNTWKNTTFRDNNASLSGSVINVFKTTLDDKIGDSYFINNHAEGALIDLANVTYSSFEAIFINNTGESILLMDYVNDTNICNNLFLDNDVKSTVIINLGNNVKVNSNIFLNNATAQEILGKGVNADNNWFGYNTTNYKIRPNLSDDIDYDTWLFLNATVGSNLIPVFNSTGIIFRLCLYNAFTQNVSEYNNTLLLPIDLTITSTNGYVDNPTAKLGHSIRYAATSAGEGSVTASIENVVCTIEFNIDKINPNLSAPNQVITYGENATIALNYNANATGKVNITLTGKKGTFTYQNLDLNATIVLSNDVPADEYCVTVLYSGDGNFTNATANATLKVNKANSTLTINGNITFDYNTNGSATVSFTNASGVNASVVGQPNAIVVVNDTTITVSGLDAGNYTLSVTTITDANHNSMTKTTDIIVNKAKTVLAADAITATYNINKDLVITLKDANGNPLTGVNLKVDLNGAKTYTTDNNGQIKVSTKGLAPKTYTAKITFNGNTNYEKSAKNVKVTVKKATPKLTAKKKTFKTSVKTKKYTITLKDNVGKPIKKAKVTLKVKGKTYKAKTNSKGKATFKIKKLNKKGKFKAVIKFKGNKYYKKVTKKAKIKVIITFKTVSKGSKDKATVKEIQQALKDHGYYLTYKGQYLKIDGIYHGCTERSIKEFQKDKGLKVTGKVDEKTAKKLGIL